MGNPTKRNSRAPWAKNSFAYYWKGSLCAAGRPVRTRRRNLNGSFGVKSLETRTAIEF